MIRWVLKRDGQVLCGVVEEEEKNRELRARDPDFINEIFEN